MHFLSKILKIILIDLTLSGDNAVVIGMAAHRLEPRRRKVAIVVGGAAAIVLRVGLTAVRLIFIRSSGIPAWLDDLQMKSPEGSSFWIESTGFERVFDGSVTGMDLRCKAPNSPATGESNKALQQLVPYPSIARRMFYEHFHQIHCLPSIFRPPLEGRVDETADSPVILGYQNNAKLRGRKNLFVHASSILRCRTRIPLVQKFFGELAHPVEVSRFGGSDWSRRHSDSSHYWNSRPL